MKNNTLPSQYRTPQLNNLIEIERADAAQVAREQFANEFYQEQESKRRHERNKLVRKRKFGAKIALIAAATTFTTSPAGQKLINTVKDTADGIKTSLVDKFTDGNESNRTFEPGDAGIIKNANLRSDPSVMDSSDGSTNTKDSLNRTLFVPKEDIHYVKTDVNGKWYEVPGKDLGGTGAEKSKVVYINGQNIDFNPKSK